MPFLLLGEAFYFSLIQIKVIVFTNKSLTIRRNKLKIYSETGKTNKLTEKCKILLHLYGKVLLWYS